MLRDLRYGFRQLRGNPLFAIVVIVLLATGIGANTVIFSFVNSLLLKPLPVRNPGNLFLLEKNYPKQVRPDTAFAYRQVEEVAQRKDLFSEVVAEQTLGEASVLPFGEAGGVRLVMAQVVSPNYFLRLGVSAMVGRTLSESDATASANIPVVLSYQFWESQFGKRDVLGRTIRLRHYPFVIVGVLPRDFHSLDVERAPDVRLPISAIRVLTGHAVEDPAGDPPASFQILARLAPGVSAAHAASALLTQMQASDDWLARQANFGRPQPLSAGALTALLERAREYRLAWRPVGRGISQLRDQFSRALQLLMSAVVLLLFAVCANVTGLLLSKSEERRREIAVRLSIGASRWRILRQLLSENLLLALPGAFLGLAFTYALTPLMVRLLPAARAIDQYVSPRILTVTPDARVLLFAATVSIITIFAFGMAPALQARKVDLNAELKGGGRGSARGVPGAAPIALQVALSVLLLATATLMLRTYWDLEHLNPGFDRAHIAAFTLDPRDAGYSDTQAGVFFRELKQRVAAISGIRAVAYADRGVMRGAGIKMTVTPQGVMLPRSTFLNTSLNRVSTSYFETMGTPLLAGRNLQEGDRNAKRERIVVNRALAELLFGHRNPLGRLLVDAVDGTKPPFAIIVGMTETAKYRSMREADPPTFYSLIDENQKWARVMYVRTYGDPARMIGAVREAIRGLDAAMPIMEVTTLEQEVQNSLWQERLVGLLSLFFGVVAALLAGIGLYGALAYSVARRTRELGIRIAVGAQMRHIIRAVCWQITWSVAFGLAAGVIASVLLLRLTQHLLYGVKPLDPLSFFSGAGGVLLCAILAAAVPTWRAMNLDASRALREE